MESVILGGGCFWCTEAIFKRVKGIIDVQPGYSGGSVVSPTYEQICNEETGHAEVIKVDYDPQKISYSDILDIFFATHDPTTINRQGNDVGTQYRSVIFYTNDEQKAQTETKIQELNNIKAFTSPIVTTVESAKEFYPAEEYHKNYFERNPNAGYCRIIIDPKVRKLLEKFPEKVA